METNKSESSFNNADVRGEVITFKKCKAKYFVPNLIS